MHACNINYIAMSDWSHVDRDSGDPYIYYAGNPSATTSQEQVMSTKNLTLFSSPPANPALELENYAKGESSRELRNKAEKQRRDKINKSIAQLASIVPPVAIPGRKIDKTSVLRLTAHYLRSHQHVFGDSLERAKNIKEFSSNFTKTLLQTFRGFLIVVTYKGLFVVVSPNVQEYLGYTELELLGQNIYYYVHEKDHNLLSEQLMPKSCKLGLNGELLLPEDAEGKQKIADDLVNERRNFVIRFRKRIQRRADPVDYLTCHIEGSLRKSDRACQNYHRNCQIIRRVRFRGEKPRSSGNDVVFIGVARPTVETFMTEGLLEAFKMEYRTRHSIDGQIIQCEQRISLVTGYMIHEVNGVNAMNFMHRDDVRWVIIALREMYDERRLFGESCYRLRTKNGCFIYMRTHGYLDVDKKTNAVTSFVCTNTVVNEKEGKELIRLMKKKYMILINNGDTTDIDEPNVEEESDESDISVEDPKQLQEVILHLVTNLPANENVENSITESSHDNNVNRLSIIPPKKERILDGILKSTSIIGYQNQLGEPSNAEGLCGDISERHIHETENSIEPPNEEMSDESLMEALTLDPIDQLKIDTNGIHYKDILEEAYLNKNTYFENINY